MRPRLCRDQDMTNPKPLEDACHRDGASAPATHVQGTRRRHSERDIALEVSGTRPKTLAMHRYLGVVLAAGLLTAAVPREAAAAKTAPVVCLQPLGEHDARALPVVAHGIEYLYGLEVRTLAARPLPGSAWYAPRKRYRAEKILHHLDSAVVPDSGCDLVMGWTSADISTTKGSHQDWGMLGYAWIHGPSGVVSTHRMGGVSRVNVLRRAVKVVNHELGHALGLRHDAGCLMADVGGTVKTLDRESGLLCDDSRRTLEVAHGITLPLRGWFDWGALR